MKVAINGFGRIGRNVLRVIFESKEAMPFDVVGINDTADTNTMVHLFKYDTCFGKFEGNAEVVDEKSIKINGKTIQTFSERDPEKLPWGDLGVDLVIEATGAFRTKEKAQKHIHAGAKRVLITAPAKDEDITIVMGVNEAQYDGNKHFIISNASCTTNCLAPFTKIVLEKFGIESGLMTTIHSYTNDQRILDGNHSDLRRARAAAESMIPTTTGAAKAVSLVLPQLKGKLNGMAVRVPTPTVSLVDVVFHLEKETTVEEVNKLFKEASEGSLKGILGYTEEELVSIDFKKDGRSSIVDAKSTMMVGDKMLKVLSWYDNEWGYSCRVVDLAKYVLTH